MRFNRTKSCLFRISKDAKKVGYILNLQIDSHDVGSVDKLNYLDKMYFDSCRIIRVD